MLIELQQRKATSYLSLSMKMHLFDILRVRMIIIIRTTVVRYNSNKNVYIYIYIDFCYY